MNWIDIEYDTNQLSGDGILDFFKPELSKYPKASQKVLDLYGNNKVVSLTIYRTPLKEFNNFLVNIVSLGSYNKIRKELNHKYDKMYHLALVANVVDHAGNMKNVVIEKHARVNISTEYTTADTTETMPVNLQGKSFSINDMTETLRRKQGDKYYFDYSALGGNNCQNYVLELLKTQRLLTPELQNFIYQDITPILEKLAPHTTSVSDFITKFWAWKDRLLGRGKGGKGLFVPDDKYYHLLGGKGLIVPTDTYYHYLGSGARPFNTRAFARQIVY